MEQHKPRSNQPKELLRHYLEDIVYGANDGIVTTFTVICGVEGAKLSPLIVITLGFVNLFADGISMGASRFLSIRAGSQALEADRGYVEPLIHSICTFLSFFIFGFIPLGVFLIPGLAENSFMLSSILAGALLFTIGSLRGLLVKEKLISGGIEMLLIGGVVAIIAYQVGNLITKLI